MNENDKPQQDVSPSPPIDGAPGKSNDDNVVDIQQVQPDLTDVPVDDEAEPQNAETTHKASIEDVEAQE